jgi:TRAP-type C4-dicarboxylate transport system permease small subunit
MAVDNVIIQYRDRPEGSESKLNTYSDGFKVLRTILRLFRTYRPMRFYSLLSLLMVIVAGILFAPVGVTYVQTGQVPRFPTMITCGFIVLAAIVSFFAGMILQSIYSNERQRFELDLYREMESASEEEIRAAADADAAEAGNH